MGPESEISGSLTNLKPAVSMWGYEIENVGVGTSERRVRVYVGKVKSSLPSLQRT